MMKARMVVRSSLAPAPGCVHSNSMHIRGACSTMASLTKPRTSPRAGGVGASTSHSEFATSIVGADRTRCSRSSIISSLVSGNSCRIVLCHSVSGRDRPLIPRSFEAADELGSLRLSPERTRTVASAGRCVEPASCKVGSARVRGHSEGRYGMSDPEVVAVGIDVAKASLDVAVRPSGEHQHWSNDATGIMGAIAWLQSVHPGVIVVEATGGYEAPVVAELGLAGLPVAGVHPRPRRPLAPAPRRPAQKALLAGQRL